jgi:hypothetical protein
MKKIIMIIAIIVMAGTISAQGDRLKGDTLCLVSSEKRHTRSHSDSALFLESVKNPVKKEQAVVQQPKDAPLPEAKKDFFEETDGIIEICCICSLLGEELSLKLGWPFCLYV